MYCWLLVLSALTWRPSILSSLTADTWYLLCSKYINFIKWLPFFFFFFKFSQAIYLTFFLRIFKEIIEKSSKIFFLYKIFFCTWLTVKLWTRKLAWQVLLPSFLPSFPTFSVPLFYSFFPQVVSCNPFQLKKELGLIKIICTKVLVN